VPFLALGTGFQPDLSAIDNIVMYGLYLGLTKKEIRQRIPEILSYSELERFSDTKLKHFSAGMYARLAFATAVQVDPDILLVDEVLSVGDVSFQEKSFETFLSFKKEGKTIVFVTHALDLVKRLCDRAIFIQDGKIRKIGRSDGVVEEFYNFYELDKGTNRS
jgi:lipopolysaccharide transport system ATP-binding protein